MGGCRCFSGGRVRFFGGGCLHPSLSSKAPQVLRRSPTDRAATVATDERDNVVEMHESRSDAEGEPRTGFEDFVRAQYHALVRFLRRRNSIEDAEEIAQESIISLMQYREKGQVSDWRPLLYRIATNHATKRARREAPHRIPQAVEADSIAADAPSPEEEAEHAQRAELLQAAILDLPPKCRRVYLLRHRYNLSHAQIATRCGISIKTVEKHLKSEERRVGKEGVRTGRSRWSPSH